MATPLRVEFAGAVYHVMARGNHGQRICADAQDRQIWRATPVQGWKRTGWHIQLPVLRAQKPARVAGDRAGAGVGHPSQMEGYGNTTVKRRWIAEKLAMGYETRVSQAVSEVERSREPFLAMKNQLIQYAI